MTDETVFIERYGEVLGRGKTALICGTDDVAAKIYVEGFDKAEIFHEAFLMALVEKCQLPVPQVYGIDRCGDRYVLRMSRAKGKSLGDYLALGEITPAECMDIMVPLQVQMHQIHLDSSVIASKAAVFRTNILYNPRLTDAEKQKLLQMLERMPAGNSLCHGDFHAGNLQVDNGSCTILDWAEVSSGPAAADACRTYMDYQYLGKYLVPEEMALALAELFLEKYTAATGMSREEILAWLPFNAAAIYGFVQGEEMNRELYAILQQENLA